MWNILNTTENIISLLLSSKLIDTFIVRGCNRKLTLPPLWLLLSDSLKGKLYTQSSLFIKRAVSILWSHYQNYNLKDSLHLQLRPIPRSIMYYQKYIMESSCQFSGHTICERTNNVLYRSNSARCSIEECGSAEDPKEVPFTNMFSHDPSYVNLMRPMGYWVVFQPTKWWWSF